jgi:hypothetical protein
MLREVTVALPPRVAERGLVLDGTLTADLESATLEITALDRDGEGLAALGVLLLRTESVASSRIELARPAWTTTPVRCTVSAATRRPPRWLPPRPRWTNSSATSGRVAASRSRPSSPPTTA